MKDTNPLLFPRHLNSIQAGRIVRSILPAQNASQTIDVSSPFSIQVSVEQNQYAQLAELKL